MSDDRDEICNLIARYAELLNLGRIDELGELFRHGRITSTTNDDVHVGSEAVAEMYRTSVRFPEKLPDTLLFTSNLQVEVDGDSATSKAYFLGDAPGIRWRRPGHRRSVPRRIRAGRRTVVVSPPSHDPRPRR